MNDSGVGMRLMVFARSVLALAFIAILVPLALIVAAQQRFGSGSPFAGVVGPSEWSIDRIWGALTDRLTDQTIADVVIRLSLLVAWVAVIVIVVTVVAEVAHMLRHDGLAMPDVRGLGMSQRTARIIAAGLLVIIPLFTSPASAIAKTGPTLLPAQRATAMAEAPTHDASGPWFGATAAVSVDRHIARPTPDVTHAVVSAAPQAGAEYIVRAGDSVFGIAERLAGPERATIDAYAEQLIDLNLGRQMPDGRFFNNAAFLDVGWVLELPAVGAPTSHSPVASDAGPYIVEQGDSLWSIADDELGDPLRWPEVFEANEGRTFDDGRVLSDPHLIHPGWDIALPVDAVAAPAQDVIEPTVEPPVDQPADAEIDAEIIHVDPHPEVESMPDANEAAEGSTGGVFESPGGVSGVDASVARQDNVWGDELAADEIESQQQTDPVEAPAIWNSEAGPTWADDTPADQERESQAPDLLTLGRAAMLSAGILTLLAVRRRNQLRRARPRSRIPEPPAGPAATERSLRSIDSGERFSRVDIASRAVALQLIDRDQRLLAVIVAADGALEIRTSGHVELAAPWEGSGTVWHLSASTPLEMLAQDARRVGAPCPTLVQLGSDDAGRDVYVDLEALEAVEVGGPGGHADAIVAAVAATLAASVLAEVTTLIGLGVPDDAFLGHRHYVPVRNGQQAFAEASDAIGSTASMTRSTFDLRARGTSGETWEPAVVLAGSAAGTVTPPTKRTGLAVVSASPIHGASSRLAPDGDAWVLLPLDIRLTPVGLTGDDIGAIAELVAVVEPLPVVAASPSHAEVAALDGDHTIVGSVEVDDAERFDVHDGRDDETAEPAVSAVGPMPEYALLVRLLGAVEVVDHQGDAVQFERSKTRELVAWLATHRDLSTRAAARTALWELDVRDATFANVVSEARRSLARLVEPSEGEEWVGRTNTEALPLHELVRTDVDLVRHALNTARVQPPAQAIATLEPAVDLITGMPFAGTAYLWPDSEGITSNLVLLATTATTELAAHCLSVGDVQGVFDATSRGLQVLPGHEELIGLRMQAHARAGDHAGVRLEWETYERVINGDPWSDGEPAPKLVDLRQRLLNPSR